MSITRTLSCLVILLVVKDIAAVMPQYGQKYQGRCTYYGTPPMAPNTHTHCHLPNNLMGMRTIAMNADQYEFSKVCGMCVRVHGSGKVCLHGIDPGDNSCGLGADPVTGTFDAVVTDELWERGYGDIDIGMHGDGHWPVSWEPITCPWDPKPAIALHAGGSKYYVKVQMRYLDSPMDTMELNGMPSTWRFHDNFFVFFAEQDQSLQPMEDGLFHIKVKSVLGKTYCGTFDQSMKAEPFEYAAWPC